jgi:hypothetical protein
MLATPLEAVPQQVTKQVLGSQGWTPGKHRA